LTTSLAGELKDIEKRILYIIHGVIILFIPAIKGIAGTTRGGYGKVRGDNWDETRLPHGRPRLAVNKYFRVNGVGNDFAVHLLLSSNILPYQNKYISNLYFDERYH
jgi:hypothetical protein